MSLSQVRRQAERMKQEFARLGDKPATFADISQVFAAVEDLAQTMIVTEINRPGPDPRLFTDDSARGGR